MAASGAGDVNTRVGRPGAPIRGRASLAESVGAAEGTLFIIARLQGATGGPPLAVLRVPNPVFPVDFEIGPDQVMIPSMKFEGLIDLGARLDADGDAMTRDAGEPRTQESQVVAPGTLGVELVLQ